MGWGFFLGYSCDDQMLHNQLRVCYDNLEAETTGALFKLDIYRKTRNETMQAGD